jgi:hypothetical protein
MQKTNQLFQQAIHRRQSRGDFERRTGFLKVLIDMSGVLLNLSISLPDKNYAKLNQQLFSLWIVVTNILRNPFDSLHPGFKDAVQSLWSDRSDHLTNSCK